MYAKQALNDAKKLAASGLKSKAQELLAILEFNPFQNPPAFEKLVGDLQHAASIFSTGLSTRFSRQNVLSVCSECGRTTSESAQWFTNRLRSWSFFDRYYSSLL